MLLPVYGFSIENWCKRYNLEISEIECPNCGFIQKTTIPFIAKDSVGLLAPLHNCGPDWQAGTATPRDRNIRNRWSDMVCNILSLVD